MVSEVSATNEVEFSYTLNSDASSVTITVSNGDEFVITDAAYLTRGSHTVTKELTVLIPGGYTWSVTAVGIADRTNIGTAPAQFTDNDANELKFFSPRGGVVMDKNMESPFFGRMYITESLAGTAGGRTTQDGIYILDAALQDVTGQGNISFTGGVNWVRNAASADMSPYRISVAADGSVFIPSYWGADYNVWIMDPANPAANFTAAFENAAAQPRAFQAHLVGNDLFTLGHMNPAGVIGAPNATFDIRIQRYEDFSAGATVTGTSVKQMSASEIIVATSSFVPCGNGGWWLAQNRAGAGESSWMYLNASGVRTLDFRRADAETQVNRGAIAYCQDRNLLAVGTNPIRVYNVIWTDGVPTLGTFMTIPAGGINVDGLEFDPAGNLYFVSSTVERLRGFALPNATAAGNTFTTQAPASQKITIGPSVGIREPETTGNNVIISVSGRELTLTSDAPIQSLRIFDVQGRLLMFEQGVSSGYTTTMQHGGVFIIETVTDNGNREVQRVIVR